MNSSLSKLKKNLGWIFDTRPPSGRTMGGSPTDLIIKSEIKGVTERESGSNSGDQALSSTKPVKLFYDLIELSGNDKKVFLDEMDWLNLEKHLKGSSKGASSDFKKRIAQGIKDVNGEKLICLRVSDYNAQGLVGGEKDVDKNFHLFCKATLDTPPDKTRQGSFGIGKGVFWSHSKVSTVLMSSTVPKKKNGKLRTRIFGRSELISHECNTKKWNSSNKWDVSGFFGEDEVFDQGSHRAVSHWVSKKSLPKKLFLERHLPERGSTFLSIAYYDPLVEGEESVQEIIEKIEAYVKEWLWPGISKRNSSPTLEVSVRHFENTTLKYDKLIDTSGWEPFEEACFNVQNSKKLNNPGDLSERTINFTIPERTEPPKHTKIEGEACLRLIKYPSGVKFNKRENQIALLRKDLCVVRYENVEALNQSDDPAYGVLLAGTAKGTSQKDTYTSYFLRDSEPPLHNDWLPHEERLKLNYKRGYGPAITTLHDCIRNEAKDMLAPKINVTKSDFSHLSKDFNFGGGGIKENPKARSVQILSHTVRNNTWFLEARIKNLSTDIRDWDTLFKCTYAVESGTTENLTVEIKKITSGAVIDPLERNIAKAQKTIDEFDLSIEAQCSSIFTSKENVILPISLYALPQE